MTNLNKLQSYAAPLGRVLLSLIFVIAGAQKLTAYGATQQYMEYMGVPGALLPLVILTELGGGLALLLGWNARLAAFLLAGFSVLSGLMFHLSASFGLEGMAAQAEITNFLKNVSIAGGLLMVTSFGAGAVAVDRKSVAPAE